MGSNMSILLYVCVIFPFRELLKIKTVSLDKRSASNHWNWGKKKNHVWHIKQGPYSLGQMSQRVDHLQFKQAFCFSLYSLSPRVGQINMLNSIPVVLKSSTPAKCLNICPSNSNCWISWLKSSGGSRWAVVLLGEKLPLSKSLTLPTPASFLSPSSDGVCTVPTGCCKRAIILTQQCKCCCCCCGCCWCVFFWFIWSKCWVGTPGFRLSQEDSGREDEMWHVVLPLWQMVKPSCQSLGSCSRAQSCCFSFAWTEILQVIHSDVAAPQTVNIL